MSWINREMALRVRLRPVLRTVILALLTLAWAGSAAAEEAQPPATILTLYWSSESFPGTQVLDAVIEEVVRRYPKRIDYFAEYLESDRFPDEDASLAFADYIHRKYRGRQIDVVIAVTGVALQFVLRHRTDLFPDAPIVFSAFGPPDAGISGSEHGLTGVLYGNGVGETLQMMQRLHPSCERIFYVAESSDAVWRESIRTQLREAGQQVELKEIDETSIAKLVAAIKAVPANSLILYVRYSQEDAGNVVFPSQAGALVAQASPVPVYTSSESQVGSGSVGGVVSSSQAIGTRLGEMVHQILAGTRPEDIPIESTSVVPMFDWRQLRRWDISENVLPANSIVLFREISIWQRYRAAILATASVLLLQSLLIGGLLAERKRRRRAELESRRNLVAMTHLDRRAATGELATSLAHELSQPLNAILQNAGVAQMLLTSTTVPAELAEMREIISDIRSDDLRASEVIRRMRGLLQKHELESHPVDLNEVAQETLAVVHADARSRDIQVDMKLADGLATTRGDRVHLQQVLLNLLMNAMDAVTSMPTAHRRVKIETMESDGEVRLAVSDTGKGIPADRIADIFEPFYTTKSEGSGMGMGLAIAQNIVEAHAGRMGAENNAAGGATVWFSVPKQISASQI